MGYDGGKHSWPKYIGALYDDSVRNLGSSADATRFLQIRLGVSMVISSVFRTEISDTMLEKMRNNLRCNFSIYCNRLCLRRGIPLHVEEALPKTLRQFSASQKLTLHTSTAEMPVDTVGSGCECREGCTNRPVGPVR